MTQQYDEYGYVPGYPPEEPEGGPLDAESALADRLKTWLETLSFQHSGDGSVFNFARISTEWADDEQEEIGYPSGSLVFAGNSERTPYSLSPVWMGDTSDGRKLYSSRNVTVPLQLDLYCRDRFQRRDVQRVLDNEFNQDFQSTDALLLTMPKYYGVTGRFNFTGIRRWDDPKSNRVQDFRLTVFITAMCPVVRVVNIPTLTDPEAVVEVSTQPF